MQKFISLIIIYLALASSGLSQNLDKLTDRAKHLLALRANDNKAEAVRYIEASSRNDFLSRKPFPLSNPRLMALEFTDDPKMVDVVFRATFDAPDVGPFPATVREPWIWDGKEWFMRLPSVGSPFDAFKSSPATAGVEPISFELSSKEINLGKHIQGEIVKRTLDIKSEKDRVLLVRPMDLPGLTMTGPVWTSKDDGKLEFTLDTTLLSQNVNYNVGLEVLGLQQQKIKAELHLTAEIEPQLRLSQSPSAIDPFKAGVTEITIENLSSKTFKPLSIVSTSPAYRITNDAPALVAPGQSMKLIIAHEAQQSPTGATFNVIISEPILAGKATFVLPLNVQLPVSAGAGYTKEELEEMLKKVR